jgi:hypothetical protein
MFTRSTLPMLAAVVSLACGSSAGAEAYDPAAAVPVWRLHTHTLSSSPKLRSDTVSLRSVGRDSIEAGWPVTGLLRSELAAWGNDGAARTNGRLNFDRSPDDERAGSSTTLISLGRLNLGEPRGAALGGATQSDLDRELAQLRDSMNRVRPVPQVSLGMRVKF